MLRKPEYNKSLKLNLKDVPQVKEIHQGKSEIKSPLDCQTTEEEKEEKIQPKASKQCFSLERLDRLSQPRYRGLPSDLVIKTQHQVKPQRKCRKLTLPSRIRKLSVPKSSEKFCPRKYCSAKSKSVHVTSSLKCVDENHINRLSLPKKLPEGYLPPRLEFFVSRKQHVALSPRQMRLARPKGRELQYFQKWAILRKAAISANHTLPEEWDFLNYSALHDLLEASISATGLSRKSVVRCWR